QAGREGKPRIVAVEAAGLAAMEMLGEDGILTIGAVSMPGSAPVLRLMMYPDGARLGVERIAASVEHALARVGELAEDVEAVREKLLGQPTFARQDGRARPSSTYPRMRDRSHCARRSLAPPGEGLG